MAKTKIVDKNALSQYTEEMKGYIKSQGLGLTEEDINGLIDIKLVPVNETIEDKVDKVDGMGLSTNDYTDEDKARFNYISDNLITFEEEKGDTMQLVKVPSTARGEYIKYYEDISPYRNGVINEEDNTKLSTYHTLYPRLTFQDGCDYQEYVFYGWFVDENCSTSVSPTTFSGSAYARFVSIDMMRTYYQIDPYKATMDEEKVSLRIIFPIFDLSIESSALGYRLGRINKNTSFTNYATTVYESLAADNHNYRKVVSQFDEKCSYLAARKVGDIDPANYSAIAAFNARILTYDETVLTGFTNCVRVKDAILIDTIHCPIVMNSNYEITEGQFDILFDSALYNFKEYIDCLQADLLEVDTSDVETGVIHIHFTCNEPKMIQETIVDISFEVIPSVISGDDGVNSQYRYIPERNNFKVTNQKYYNGSNPVIMRIPDGVAKYSSLIPTSEFQPIETASTMSLRAAAPLALSEESTNNNDGLISCVVYSDESSDNVIDANFEELWGDHNE